MAKYSIPETAIFQELGGEAVILNLHNERYFGLDEVGTTFWSLLSSHQDHEIIVQRMLEEFDVDEATLRADLELLITDMEKAGLIKVEQ